MLIPTTVLTSSGGGGGLFDAYAYLRDEKTAGTPGGAATTGSWQTRTLNTEVFDPGGIVSLSANQFALQAGTYAIRARAPFFRTQRTKIKLRNITDSTDDIVGTNVYTEASTAGDSVECDLWGRITIASAKTFELQYQVGNTDGGNTNCLGIAANYGVIEIYSEVEIWREAA